MNPLRTDFSAILIPRSDQPHSGPLHVGPWQLELDAAPQSIHRQPGLTAVMKGQIYGMEVDDLLGLYRQHGPDFALHIDGCFALLLLDETAGTVLAVTDRVGSHKLYAAQDAGRLTVSTRPGHPDFARRPYDPAALASVLVGGAVLNNLSLYAGVQSLPRGSTHELRPTGIRSRMYWELRPPQGSGTRSDAELQEEFAELLQRSVRRRAGGIRGPVHLSLSGGHDSRGLLSLLAKAGSDIHTFSYTQGPQARDSDTRVADALAAQYGVRHQAVQAYRGDLISTLRRNAQWGGGVTHFCDEADAWDTLTGQGIGHVFTGEELHEVYPHALTDVAEQFAQWGVFPFSVLEGLTGAFAPTQAGALADAWAAELEQMRAQLVRYSSPYQQDFMVFSQQRQQHVLLPWRERFAGRGAAVHLPYLDAEVLEFIQRLPTSALVGKRLFRQTLRHLDPDLYRVPLAQSSGYLPDWHAELIKHRAVISEELLSVPSRLDEVISPQAIRAVLDGLRAPSGGGPHLRGQVRRTLGRVRRSQVGQRVFGQARIRAAPVQPATWLLRVLTLRLADTGLADTGHAADWDATRLDPQT
ncbi:asparagine synthase-related protein [Deinococcus arenicola]|uniref:asparagine synthase (glutamine-hydrolyzing) n=1 Tax=Deinococcus arenicola TaxID=2994950 RepID=A0ABU4DSF8_9DEIO|nr:asparagine synthase-related protein [Deinococcus sp. ZS9-10]MDV6375366.1 asparagine synthase-related protein [Deinococcus sp. ZS9-10]